MGAYTIMKWVYIFLISVNFLSAAILEEIIYYTKYRSLRVGHTKISLMQDSTKTEETILTVQSQSNKLIDLIYKLRHFSTSILNTQNFSLLATTQKIQQGRYIDSYNATVDYKSQKIYYQNTEDITHQKKKETVTIPIKNLVYDPFCIVYYLRKLNLEVGEHYIFTSYSKKKIKNLTLYVEKIETINTPYFKGDCFVVIPRGEQEDGPLLKNQGAMKIWFTKNQNKIPVKIQMKMKSGIMELVLKDYVTS